jgi:hypothetical protein
MAKLFVHEFEGISELQGGVQIASGFLRNNNVIIDVAHAESAPFGEGCKIIRVHTDVNCVVVFGPAGTEATADSMRMAAGQTEYWPVQEGWVISTMASA